MKYKLDIKIRLQKLLQDNEIILYITRSSINELNSVGNKAKSALEFASTCCTIIEDDSFTGETAGEKLIEYLSILVPFSTLILDRIFNQ